MKYGNNEHCLKCKSPNDKYKTGAEQTRTYTNIKHPLPTWSNPARCVLFVVIRKTGKFVDML